MTGASPAAVAVAGVGTGHSRRAGPALRLLTEADPALGALALWCRHRDAEAGPAAPAAWTDGATIWYGPGFAALSLAEQVGLAAHQVLHAALRHAARADRLRARLGARFDADLWALACDAILNRTLELAGHALPRPAVTLPGLLAEALPDAAGVTVWDAETLYFRLAGAAPAGGGGAEQGKPGKGKPGKGTAGKGTAGKGTAGQGTAGQGTAGQGMAGQGRGPADPAAAARAHARARDFRPDLVAPAQAAAAPGADAGGDGPAALGTDAGGAGPEPPPAPAAADPTIADPAIPDAAGTEEWQARLARALALGRGAGRGIGTLGAGLLDLPPPAMPWERVLRRLLARALVEAALPDWRRPSRRWLAADADARAHARPAPAFEPGRARPAARMRLAVAVDTSGSVGAPLLARFAAEIAGIGRRTGAEVHVLGFDTAVTLRAVMQGADWARQIRALAFTRGGGTDFAPALRAAADLSPSAIVVLSDLIGPTGPPPGRIPVIWAVPRRPAAPPPFGRVLLLDG